jgi:hypothetical protein
VAVLTLMLALVAACKGGKKSDSGSGKTPAAEQSPSSDETPDGGGNGDGGGGDDEALQDLERFASQAAEDFTGSVTYKYSTEAGGQSTEQEWTYVQKPPNRRFEVLSNEGGQESRTIVISTAEKSYICTSAGGSESCLASEQTEGYTTAFAPLFDVPRDIAAGIDVLGLADHSERDIAGMHANCYSVDFAAAAGGNDVCFSDEGLLLYLHGEAAGSSFTFEAKSASTDVSDADFEPPYEVLELPG